MINAPRDIPGNNPALLFLTSSWTWRSAEISLRLHRVAIIELQLDLALLLLASSWTWSVLKSAFMLAKLLKSTFSWTWRGFMDTMV